jgi:hypothetical protein
MSVATLAGILDRPQIPWFKAPAWFHRLGAAGQQLFGEYLWFATRFGKDPIKVTDWQMAQACGRGLRWVQKALRQLLDLVVDDQPVPIIGRYTAYGRKDQAGRVIEIVITPDLAAPKPRARPTPAAKSKAKDPGKPAASQTPNVGPAKPTTPEQLGGAAATHAETDRINHPEENLSPEEQAEAAANGAAFATYWLDRAKKKLAAEEATKAARAGRGPSVKRTPEELRAQLDSLKHPQQHPSDPAGPEVPAPGEGS